MIYNYYSGESDGIKWSVDYDSELGNWIVVATDGKNKATREFFSVHDPVFGVDGIDMEQIETAIDRATGKMQGDGHEPRQDVVQENFQKKKRIGSWHIRQGDTRQRSTGTTGTATA